MPSRMNPHACTATSTSFCQSPLQSWHTQQRHSMSESEVALFEHSRKRCVGCSRCSSCSAASITTWIHIPPAQVRLPTSPAKLSDVPTTLSTTTLAEGGSYVAPKGCSQDDGGNDDEEEEGQFLGLCSRCLELRANENYCPLCQGCYEDDDYDARMMECGRCKEWIHAQCEGLSNEHYQILSCLPDSVEYVCRLCLGANSDNYLNPIMGELKAGMELVLKNLLSTKCAKHLIKRDPFARIPLVSRPKRVSSLSSNGGKKTISDAKTIKAPPNSSCKVTITDESAKDVLSHGNAESRPRTTLPLSALKHDGPQENVPSSAGNEEKASVGDLQLEGEEIIRSVHCSTPSKASSDINLEDKNFPLASSSANVHDIPNKPLDNHSKNGNTAQGENNGAVGLGSESEESEMEFIQADIDKIVDSLADVNDKKLFNVSSSSGQSFVGFQNEDSVFSPAVNNTDLCIKKVDPKLRITKDIDDDVVSSDESSFCDTDSELDSVIEDPDEPKDLVSIKDRLAEHKYDTVLQFHVDVCRVIEANKYLCRGQTKNVLTAYERYMKESFPWFGVHSVNIFDLIDKLHPFPRPNEDHSYAVVNSSLASAESPELKRTGASKETFISPNKTQLPMVPFSQEPLVPTGIRKCVLCSGIGDGPPQLEGRLLYLGQDEWLHVNCGLWSSEVFEEQDGELQKIYEATSRGRMIKCNHCNERGATVGCCHKNCSATYHFRCAINVKCQFLEDKRLFCALHKSDISDIDELEDFSVSRRVYVGMNSLKKRWKRVLGSKVNVTIGSLTIHSLGRLLPVSDSCEALIPVDFVCSRLYWSTVDPRKKVRYICRTKRVVPAEAIDVNDQLASHLVIDHSKDSTIVKKEIKRMEAWFKKLEEEKVAQVSRETNIIPPHLCPLYREIIKRENHRRIPLLNTIAEEDPALILCSEEVAKQCLEDILDKVCRSVEEDSLSLENDLPGIVNSVDNDLISMVLNDLDGCDNGLLQPSLNSGPVSPIDLDFLNSFSHDNVPDLPPSSGSLTEQSDSVVAAMNPALSTSCSQVSYEAESQCDIQKSSTGLIEEPENFTVEYVNSQQSADNCQASVNICDEQFPFTDTVSSVPIIGSHGKVFTSSESIVESQPFISSSFDVNGRNCVTSNGQDYFISHKVSSDVTADMKSQHAIQQASCTEINTVSNYCDGIHIQNDYNPSNKQQFTNLQLSNQNVDTTDLDKTPSLQGAPEVSNLNKDANIISSNDEQSATKIPLEPLVMCEEASKRLDAESLGPINVPSNSGQDFNESSHCSDMANIPGKKDSPELSTHHHTVLPSSSTENSFDVSSKTGFASCILKVANTSQASSHASCSMAISVNPSCSSGPIYSWSRAPVETSNSLSASKTTKPEAAVLPQVAASPKKPNDKKKVCRVLPMMNRSHIKKPASFPGTTVSSATSLPSLSKAGLSNTNSSQSSQPKKICMKRNYKTVIKKYPLRSSARKNKKPYQTVQIEINETIEIPEEDESLVRKSVKRKWNTVVEEDESSSCSSPERRMTRASRKNNSSESSSPSKSDNSSSVSKKVVKFSDESNDITVSIVNNNNLCDFPKSRVHHKYRHKTLLQVDGAMDLSSSSGNSDSETPKEPTQEPEVTSEVRFMDGCQQPPDRQSSLALRIKEQSLAHSSPGDSGPYKCTKCRRLYRTRESYERHIQTCTFEIDSSSTSEEDADDTNSNQCSVTQALSVTENISSTSKPDVAAIEMSSSMQSSDEPPAKKRKVVTDEASSSLTYGNYLSQRSTDTKSPPSPHKMLGVKKSSTQRRYSNINIVKGARGYQYKRRANVIPGCDTERGSQQGRDVRAPQQLTVPQQAGAQPIQISIPAFACPGSSAGAVLNIPADSNITSVSRCLLGNSSKYVSSNMQLPTSLSSSPSYAIQYVGNFSDSQQQSSAVLSNYQHNPVVFQQPTVLQPQIVQQFVQPNLVQQPLIQSGIMHQPLVQSQVMPGQVVVPQMVNTNLTYALGSPKTLVINQPIIPSVQMVQPTVSVSTDVLNSSIQTYQLNSTVAQSSGSDILPNQFHLSQPTVQLACTDNSLINSLVVSSACHEKNRQAQLVSIAGHSGYSASKVIDRSLYSQSALVMARPKGPFSSQVTTVRNVATVAPAIITTSHAISGDRSNDSHNKQSNELGRSSLEGMEVDSFDKTFNAFDRPRPSYSYRDAMTKPQVPKKKILQDLLLKQQTQVSVGSKAEKENEPQSKHETIKKEKKTIVSNEDPLLTQSYKLVLKRDNAESCGFNVLPLEGDDGQLIDQEVKELRIKAKVSLGPKRRRPNPVPLHPTMSLPPPKDYDVMEGTKDTAQDGLVNEQLANMVPPAQTPNNLIDDPNLFDKIKSSKVSSAEPYIVFELTSEDGFKVESRHMSEVWQTVFDAVAAARANLKMQHQQSAGAAVGGGRSMSGLHMLGLTHNAVQYLLEQLPGSNDCQKYSFQFHRRHREEGSAEGSPSGCARSESFKSRSPYDLFSWLASQHRRLPETDVLTPQEEIQLSTRRATSLELPMAMRYRHLKDTAREAVGVFRSGIHGRGLFCKRDIDSGEMVIEYAGQMIRASLCDIREKFYESKGIGCYMFRIDDDTVVDATMHGNAARFINHSCDPNCYSRVVDILGKKHIIIFALRKIIRGEELTYDYKFPIEDTKIPCSCGARRCRKTLN